MTNVLPYTPITPPASQPLDVTASAVKDPENSFSAVLQRKQAEAAAPETSQSEADQTEQQPPTDPPKSTQPDVKKSEPKPCKHGAEHEKDKVRQSKSEAESKVAGIQDTSVPLPTPSVPNQQLNLQLFALAIAGNGVAALGDSTPAVSASSVTGSEIQQSGIPANILMLAQGSSPATVPPNTNGKEIAQVDTAAPAAVPANANDVEVAQVGTAASLDAKDQKSTDQNDKKEATAEVAALSSAPALLPTIVSKDVQSVVESGNTTYATKGDGNPKKFDVTVSSNSATKSSSKVTGDNQAAKSASTTKEQAAVTSSKDKATPVPASGDASSDAKGTGTPAADISKAVTQVSGHVAVAADDKSVLAGAQNTLAAITGMHDSTSTTSKSGTPDPQPSPAAELEAQVRGNQTADVNGMVETAKLIQKANQAELRLNVQTPEFGRVDIQTTLSKHTLAASISVERDALLPVLAAELSSLNTRLSEHHGLQANITLNNGSHAEADSSNQQRQQTAPQQQLFGDAAEGVRADAVSAITVLSNSLLDVHA